MRLFVALDLPDPILQTLDTLIAALKPAAPRIHWSTVAKLHITTKFIGEWPEPRLGELITALKSAPRFGPIPIRIEGVGWFPNPHSPRVFWAAIHGGQPLETLARQTDAATTALGVAPETRTYQPHLTLARVKERLDLAPLRQAVARLESTQCGAFEARSQYLYLSKDSVYTKLEEFPL